MRVCPECDTEKPDTSFYAAPKMAGLMRICKKCHKERVRARRVTNPAVQAYDRERAKTPKRRANAKRVGAAWIKAHPEKMNVDRQRNPAAYKARMAVSNAIRDGRLIKGPCEVCGSTVRIHGHHEDYSKPLEVRWLCAQHHKDSHPEWHRPHIVEIIA